jgi:hypothetical protein
MSSDTNPTNKVVVNPIDSAPASSEPVNACVVANCGEAVPTDLSTGAAPVSAVLPSADSTKLPDNVVRSAVMTYPVATRPSPDGETSKRARTPDESELGQPKLAKSASGNPPTATTVVQARPSTMASQIMLVPAGPNAAMPAPGTAESTVAAHPPASNPLTVPSMPVGTEPASGAPAVALPQRQGGSAAPGTPAAPILVNSATPRQLQPGQGGALLQAMAPAQAGVPGQRGAPAQGGVMVQAGVPPMGMVQGQPWGMWPVMMQAGPGGYPGMVMQWMPTAAMATQDGGLPVRVVCRGCGLVRFDVEGRRWVHNHRQGKGNKQFACNRALCGCGQGDICPNRGQPHDPVAPGAVPAPALFAWNPGHGVSCQSSLPPLLSNPGTAAPATTVALAGGRLAAASTEGAATVAALLMIGGSGEGSTPCSLSTPHGDGSGASDFGGRSGGGDDDGSSGSGQTQSTGSGQTQSTGSGQSTGSLAL